MITFGTESEADRRYIKSVLITARRNDTAKRIAARYGHPEDAALIRDMNNLGTLGRKIRKGRGIRIPGKLRPSGVFSVMADDDPPTITGGYAKFSTLDRPARKGLTKFDGYDPLTMSVPVLFEAYEQQDGSSVEDRIEELERMAGIGRYSGSGIGPPAVVHVSTTNGNGDAIPLIPLNYQRTDANPNGPLWRVTNIEWGDNALRDRKGRRIRQKATVTLQQHTPIKTAFQASRSAAARSAYNADRKKQQAAQKRALRQARERARR